MGGGIVVGRGSIGEEEVGMNYIKREGREVWVSKDSFI